MAREIILDTETTGIDHREHRVIEIGCVEIEDFIPTGRTFHRYVNPERVIEADAERVHGISNAMVADKPRFGDPTVCEELLDFLGGAVVIAHNAQFDRSFVNAELERAGRRPVPESQWVCTWQMAQKRYPGMHNSLDALCRRYQISLTERDKHGALLDARLLAAVYLELRGGRERALDFAAVQAGEAATAWVRPFYGARPRPAASRITPEEAAAHAAFLDKALKGPGLWAPYSASAAA